MALASLARGTARMKFYHRSPDRQVSRTAVGTPLLSKINGVLSPSTLYCHEAPPFQTQVKLADRSRSLGTQIDW
jgi:hypothetical protein